MNVFDLQAVLSLNTSEYESALKGAKDSADGFGSKLMSGVGTVGGAAIKATAVAATAAASAVGAFGAMAVKSGAEFETSMAKTATLFTGTDAEFQQLNSDILAISSSTGLAASSLAEAAYSAESAGVSQSDLANMLEQSAKLAAAGFTDVDTALSATAKTMNAYGDSAGSIEDIQKVLIQTQNLGITTVGELGASLAQVTPTAAAMGLSFEQVGASLAVMTAAGTPTAQATTQLNALLGELGKSGTTASDNLMKAAEGTEYAGMSFTEMMDAGVPLNDVLSLIKDSADESGLSMLDMFSSMEAGKAALSIFGEDGQKFADNLSQMSTEMDVVGAGYDKMMNTLEAKTGVLKTSAQNFGISVFENMQTPLMELADIGIASLDSIAAGFEEGGLDGALEATGEVISNLLNLGVEKLPEFLDMGMTLLGAIGQGILDNLPTIIDSALQIVTNLLTGILGALPQLGEAAVQIITQLSSGLSAQLPTLVPVAIEAILNLVNTLISNAPELIKSAIELIKSLATGLVNSIPTLVEKIPEIISSLLTAIIEGAPELLKGALELIVQLGEGLITNIPTLVGKVPQIITDLFNAFIDGLGVMADIGKNIVDGIWEGITGAWEWLKESVGGLFGGLVSGIKETLGIASPSKVFAQIADYCVQGFNEGMEGLMDATQITRDINAGIEAVQNGIEAADIELGAGAMSGGITQIFNIYDKQQTPDELAQAIRLEARYGLMGGMAIG